MVPVSQLVVLRTNHHPSGGLVRSAITGGERREEHTPNEREDKDLGIVREVALPSAMRHTVSHATRKAW